MKTAFTICSNNYLAKAKVVADTFSQNHPEYNFCIFLVDQFIDIEIYKKLSTYTLIQADSVIQDLDALSERYNIVELSTAIKPSCAKYLFEKQSADVVIYLDPDLKIFNRFDEVENALVEHNFVLTPHFCSPIDDNKYPSDIDFIPFGIYNLGFIALKASKETYKLLDWWHERLMKYCFIRPEQGMFTDQLWMNYAPIYFDGAFIMKDLGYNMANWNLHERYLSHSTSTYLVNDIVKLKFFHFSHYDFNKPNTISKSQTRFKLDERPDLASLYEEYRTDLEKNNQFELGRIDSYYKSIYDKVQHDIRDKYEKEYYTFKRKLVNRFTVFLDKIIPD
jgi:hypothetical protein